MVEERVLLRGDYKNSKNGPLQALLFLKRELLEIKSHYIDGGHASSLVGLLEQQVIDLKMAVKEIELCLGALGFEQNEYNKGKAAKKLGVIEGDISAVVKTLISKNELVIAAAIDAAGAAVESGCTKINEWSQRRVAVHRKNVWLLGILID